MSPVLHWDVLNDASQATKKKKDLAQTHRQGDTNTIVWLWLLVQRILYNAMSQGQEIFTHTQGI